MLESAQSGAQLDDLLLQVVDALGGPSRDFLPFDALLVRQPETVSSHSLSDDWFSQVVVAHRPSNPSPQSNRADIGGAMPLGYRLAGRKVRPQLFQVFFADLLVRHPHAIAPWPANSLAPASFTRVASDSVWPTSGGSNWARASSMPSSSRMRLLSRNACMSPSTQVRRNREKALPTSTSCSSLRRANTAGRPFRASIASYRRARRNAGTRA